MSEAVGALKVGVELCVKHLAPTKNLHKGIERQAMITDLVFENAKYFDQETWDRLDSIQELLGSKMTKVAGGQSTVGWSYFFRNPSCIKKARAFASLSSQNLAETRELSCQAKRMYEKSQRTLVASQTISIQLENVALSEGTKTLDLPFNLPKGYVVSGMFYLRPAEGANKPGPSITIPDDTQSIALSGTIDLIEHRAPSEQSDDEIALDADVEVAFRDITCTVVS